MPGLFGLARLSPGPLDSQAAAALLDAMARRLGHVGGETVETWSDADHGFAIGRIGQPHLLPLPWPAAATGAGRCFFDGMLHDEEAARRRLAADPPLEADVLDALRGFFAAVGHAPPPQGRTVLATDRHASRPLFYAVVGDTLYFAPEVKALLAVESLPRRPDHAALGLFLGSGYAPGPRTLFADVHRLPAGTRLVIEDGRFHLAPYAPYLVTAAGDGTSAAELDAAVEEALLAAVERNYGDPARDVIFLSGGEDSRAILGAALACHQGEPGAIRAVCWTFARQPNGDQEVAENLARQLGIDLRVLQRPIDDYGADALRLSYLLDCLTDIGVFHSGELPLMHQLAEAGVRRVLRGDQCFTREVLPTTPGDAIRSLCLRSVSEPASWREVLHPATYRSWSAAADAAVADLVAGYAGRPAYDVGDEFYFHHRLQGYLNASGAFKQLLLDHRNPLLDEELLILMGRLPTTARRDKLAFRRAAQNAFPALWQRPFATTDDLEDHAALLATDSPVRRYVRAELDDEESPVWEHLDREALRAQLHALTPAGGGARHGGVKAALRSTAVRTIKRLPPLANRLRARYLQRLDRPEELILRAVVLKQWFDLFVAGDGSPEALTACRERAALAMVRG